MALTDNRTQLQDSNAVAEVSGDSDASPQSNTTEAGLVIEGGTALQFQVTNAQEHLLYDLDSAGATFNLDLSDSTVYIMIKDNLADTFANLGGLICFNDGADGAGGDDIGYIAAGVDVGGLPYEKKYAAYKLDVSVVVAAPGTDNVDFYTYNGVEANLDHTQILQVGYGSIHLAKGQGTVPNAWFDGIYYIANDSYAASITGGTTGTPETMTDLVGDDVTVGAGMFSNPIGAAFYIFAPTEWGAATGDTAFAGTDEQWFYLGDNGGGHSVGATHFPMRLLGGTGTNIFRQTRVSNINVGQRAEFDWSDANFDEIALSGTSWVDFGAITGAPADIDKNCDNSSFINCDQMLPGAMNMDGNTWNGATDANGAMLLSSTPADVANQTNSTFVSDGTGHAIYITTAGTYDFDHWLFSGYGLDGTTDAVVYNNSGGAVTINVLNIGDTPTVRNGASATTTINNSVTIGISGVTEGTPCLIIADETVGTLTKGDVLLEAFADSLGEVSGTLNYEGAFGAGVDVLTRARNQGVAVAAIAEDNGTGFTDETTEASSASTNDMTLLPAVPAVSDAYYFGHNDQFDRLKLDISTVLTQTGAPTFVYEYWNGAWVALSGVSDGTNGFETADENAITWTLPGDWATTTVNSQGPLYYMRIRLTAVGTITQVPIGRNAQLDTNRYLPYFAEREIVSGTGLADIATWARDTISKFLPTD